MPQNSLVQGHVTLIRIQIYDPVCRRVDSGNRNRKLLKRYQGNHHQIDEYKRLYQTGRCELGHPLLLTQRLVSYDHMHLLYREDEV